MSTAHTPGWEERICLVARSLRQIGESDIAADIDVAFDVEAFAHIEKVLRVRLEHNWTGANSRRAKVLANAIVECQLIPHCAKAKGAA